MVEADTPPATPDHHDFGLAAATVEESPTPSTKKRHPTFPESSEQDVDAADIDWGQLMRGSSSFSLSMPTMAPTRRPTSAPSATVWDVVQADPDLSILEKFVVAANLQTPLSTVDPLTVFAPVNVAFNASLGADYANMLLTDPDFGLHLRDLLFNHATDAAAYTNQDLTNGLQIDTLGNEPVTVDAVTLPGRIYLDTFAEELGFDTGGGVLKFRGYQTTSNGVLHKVHAVLVSLWFYFDLLDLLEVVPVFSKLRELIGVAGMEATIARNYTTLVAPTNAAWATLPQPVLNFLIGNPAALREVLEYNLIDRVIDFRNYPLGDTTFSTIQGQPLVMTKTQPVPGGPYNLYFDGATASTYYLAKYNVLYQIGEVLFPPDFSFPAGISGASPTSSPVVLASVPTLYEFVSNNENFSSLTQMIDAAGANVALDSAERGPFTLLGPSDVALVEAVGQTYLDQLLTSGYDLQVTSLVQYHIALSEFFFVDLTNGTVLTMANDLSIEVRKSLDTVQLITSSDLQDPVDVEMADSMASNGVLHEIGAALLPFWYFVNPKTALEGLPNKFSRFSELINAAQLDQEIAMLAHSTLCAPTNDAIADMPEETIQFLLDPGNQPILEEVVLYHVMAELLPFTKMAVGNYFDLTQQGEFVSVQVLSADGSGKLLRFNQARAVGDGFYLTKEDLIYEIDSLLIPPSLVNSIPGATASVFVNDQVNKMAVFGDTKYLVTPDASIASKSGTISLGNNQ